MKTIIRISLLLVAMANFSGLVACGGGGGGGGSVTQPVSVNTIDGDWAGQYLVQAPSRCAGFSGSWSATLATTGSVLRGSFTSDMDISGSVSGTWDGSNAIWSVGGEGGVAYNGVVSGNSVTGSFSNGPDCFGNGAVSGTFTGNRL